MSARLIFDSGRYASGSNVYARTVHVAATVGAPGGEERLIRVAVKVDSTHPEQGRVTADVWMFGRGWEQVIDLPGTWMVAAVAPSAYLPPERQHEIDDWLETMVDRLVAETRDVLTIGEQS